MGNIIRTLITLLVGAFLFAGCAGTLSVSEPGDDDVTDDDDDDDTADDDDDSADDDDDTADDDDDDTADDDTADDDDDDDVSGEYSGEIYIIVHAWWEIEGSGEVDATVDAGVLTGEGWAEFDVGELVQVPVYLDGAVSGDAVNGMATVMLSGLTEWAPDVEMEMTGMVENDGTLVADLFADLGWLGTAEGSLELWEQ